MKELLTFIVALALGFGAGYYMALPTVVSDNGDDEDTDGASMMVEVKPQTLDISEDVDEDTTPTVAITLTSDEAGGYNVQIVTENHDLTSANIGGENVLGEGYAYVYVDGRVVGRAYGDLFYLTPMEEGQHVVTVRLASNDGSELALGEDVIEASETVEVEAMEEGDAMMEDDETASEGDEMMEDDDSMMDDDDEE